MGMAIVTSQQLIKYYEEFSTVDVTFTRDIIRATLLNQKSIQLRCLGYQWPVILYSSSMTGAKIIANTTGPLREVTQKAKGMVQLRFSFLQREKSEPLSFFLNSKIASFMPYHPEQPNLSFVNLVFSNHPPDELILRLGQIVEANVAFQQRKEERIALTDEVINELEIDPKSVVLVIDGLPRKCILRDVSFSGAKIILLGLAPFLVNKQGLLKIGMQDRNGTLNFNCTVVRFEQVQGRQDLGAIAVKFDDATVPSEYKIRLSSYLKTLKRAKKVPEQGK